MEELEPRSCDVRCGSFPALLCPLSWEEWTKKAELFSLEKRRLNRDLPREHCLYLKWVLKEMDST